jgi:chromosome segregation ATPase
MEKLEQQIIQLGKEDERHERRLNDHSKRLDILEQFKSSTETEVKNLIEQIKSLVTTMRWFIGLLVGAFVSFFFYAVQQGLFK